MRNLAAVLLLLCLLGCAVPSSQGDRLGYNAMQASSRAFDLREDDPSLFKSDTEILSDSAIRRILEYELRLPASNRLAVLQVAERSLYSNYWSRTSQAPTTAPERLLETLRASPRVTHASFLPSLLVPRERAVGNLREAAARYQADVLLVYRTDCRSYERYRFLASDEVKAVCLVEAVLIDTRTGIVPFTSTVRQEFAARKSREDSNFDETVRRAEVSAIEQGLAATGGQVTAFLAQVRTIEP